MYVSRAAMSAWQLLCINVKYIVNVKVKAQQTRWTPQSTCLLWASAPAPPRVQEESGARSRSPRSMPRFFLGVALLTQVVLGLNVGPLTTPRPISVSVASRAPLIICEAGAA